LQPQHDFENRVGGRFLREERVAKLGQFFGPHSGTLKIYLAHFPVGSGSFNAFGDFVAEFSGSYSTIFASGNFTIAVSLTDQSPTSSSGPCRLTLNDQTDNAATYAVGGAKLTITTSLNSTPFDIYVSQGGTQVDNVSGHNIWIGQSA
jgi:monoamine oxidase